MYHTFRKAGAAVLAVLCAASLFAMTGCDDETTSLQPVESEYVVPVPDEKVDETAKGAELSGKVGEEIVYQENIIFKVDAVRELDKMRSASTRILFFEVSVTNNSDKELDLSFLTHFSAEVGDKTYEAGHSAVANQQATRYYYEKGLSLLHAPVPAKADATDANPNTVKGIVPVMVSADWKEVNLVYMPQKYTTNDRVVVTADEASIQHITETETE